MRSRRLLHAALLLGLSLAIVGSRPARADEDVMLQGFWWDVAKDWYDELRKEAASLARSGFTAVWLPPPYKGASGRDSMGYDVFDQYDLGEYDQKGTKATRFGPLGSLLKLVDEFRKNSVKTYVDIILTHMTGGESEDNPKNGRRTWTRFEYPHGRFNNSWRDFHAENSVDGFSFGERLDHGNPYVRDNLKEWGDWLTSRVGYEGYRIDFAKALDPGFVRDWMGHGAMRDKFAVGEFWDTDLGKLDWWSRESGASVFDFPLFYTLREMANDGTGGFDMRRLAGAGFLARNPWKAVTFVENHDTDRSQPIFRDKAMAYAYILTAEGYPSVFYKDYREYGLKPEIDNLIAIRKRLAGGSTSVLHADNNLYIASRSGTDKVPGIVVVMNNHPTEWRGSWVTVKDDWRGKELKDHTGKAQPKRVAGDGRVELFAPPRGFAVYSIDVPGFDALAPLRERDKDKAKPSDGLPTHELPKVGDAKVAALVAELEKRHGPASTDADKAKLEARARAILARSERLAGPTSNGLTGALTDKLKDRVRDRTRGTTTKTGR